jgi:hypothetical protein
MSEFKRHRAASWAAIGASVLTFAGCGIFDSDKAHQDFVFRCPPDKPIPDVSKEPKYTTDTGRKLGVSVACGKTAIKLNNQGLLVPFTTDAVAPLNVRVGSGPLPALQAGETEHTFEVDSSSSSDFTVKSIEMDDRPRSAIIIIDGATDPSISAPTAVAAAK